MGADADGGGLEDETEVAVAEERDVVPGVAEVAGGGAARGLAVPAPGRRLGSGSAVYQASGGGGQERRGRSCPHGGRCFAAELSAKKCGSS